MRYAREILTAKASALESSLRYVESMEAARSMRTRLRELEEAIELITLQMKAKRKESLRNEHRS